MHEQTGHAQMQPLRPRLWPLDPGTPDPRQEAKDRQAVAHHQELEWRRIGHPIAGNDEACAPDQYKDRRHQPDQAIIPGLACHLTRARISGNAFCR